MPTTTETTEAMLYVHVPFCKTRCIYCDFYSTTCGIEARENYVDAAIHEMHLRHHELGDATRLTSIYLGGGTPSQLDETQLSRIFEAIYKDFIIDPAAEITIEVNPDDINPHFTNVLRSLPINRVSMGIQSFSDTILRTMRRRHTAAQATTAVHQLMNVGIDNLSIDLIYGFPGSNPQQWNDDLQTALSLPISHISAYALSYEEGTPLSEALHNAQVAESDEGFVVACYERLIDETALHGFVQYEISNFARPGRHSRHNSGYWEERPYLGIGPAAHSYDGQRRRWNLSNLDAYITAKGDTTLPALHDEEYLDLTTRFNETIMRRLRTRAGLSLQELEQRFPAEWLMHMRSEALPHLRRGLLTETDGTMRLSRKGLFVSDDVISDLFRTS